MGVRWEFLCKFVKKKMQSGSASVNPLAVLKPRKKSKTYTLEEYLRREARSVHKHEYYNGKIIRMPYAKGPHNIIAANVITALNNAIESLDKDFTVFTSDQKIYFPELNYGVYADTLAVAEKPLYRDEEQLLLINPVLVVEVLSKSTESYDRHGKFDEYKTLPSFSEYVLVRQDKVYVETRFRREPGLWQETIVTEPSGHIRLQSIGCSISLGQIYKKTGL